MNQNPIDFTYQDGLNIFPLQDYIDEVISSDIVTSNIYMNDGSTKLNDICYYSSNSNLYLKNKKPTGEIRFSTYINYPENTDYNYGTKINNTGNLLVYHNYNPFQPTFSAGWYDVCSELLQLKADNISTDIQLTLLEGNVAITQAEILLIQEALAQQQLQVAALIASFEEVTSFEEIRKIAEGEDLNEAGAGFLEAYGQIRTAANNAYSRSLATGVTFGVILGLGGAVLGYLQTQRKEEIVRNLLNSNVNLTQEEKNGVFNSNIIVASNLSNISNFNTSISNLIMAQGFINSNITTAQNIPNINTNTITLNGESLTTKFGNYLLKAGGTMTGRININTGLFGTPSPVFGNGDRITLNPSSSPTTYPYSIGVDTNNFWCCIPNGATYNWYVDNVSKLSLSSAGDITTSGIVNLTTTNSYLNFGSRTQNDLIRLYGTTYGFGVAANILRYYADAAASHKFYSGATNTATISSAGDISATTFSGGGGNITGINYNNISVNALSFQTPLSKSAANQVSIDLSAYSPTSINDTRYLRLNGTNEMANTLNIRILTQYAIDIQTIDSTSINCIAFKNNTTSYAFIGLPGTTYGGNYQNNLFLQTTNGIIFNTGNTTTNGTPRMIIMSNGNIGIGTNSTTAKLDVRGLTTTENLSVVDATSYTNQFQLIINPPTGLTTTANSGALIQTIKQGIGYDQNIMLQRDGGTVTIGTNIPRSSATKLTISGSSSTYLQPLVRIVQNLAWNGNYALEVIGGGTATTGGAYVNFNGIRINGLDTGNTIYQDTLNGNMGFAVNSTNTTGGNITFTTYGAAGNIKFYTNGANERMTIQAGGNVNIAGALTVGGDLKATNSIGQISGASSYAIPNNKMATGSLTIGDTSKNFGGNSGWNANTAGMLMECQNNTEIAIHDADTRIASFMYYAGGGINQFYIGRDMGWGTIAQTNFYGNINIINSTTNKLIFDDNVNSTKIQLFSGYSFGINASTLRYDSAGVHKFLTNNNQTFIIDADGNTRATGNMVAAANMTANRYYCSATYVSFSSIVQGGTGLTYYGWFVGLNGYWYSGYSYLTISASVNMAGSGNVFCWNGRVYLSPAGGLVPTGGVLQITLDYRNPPSGDNGINVQEMWDGFGNNYLRFYGTNLNAGLLTIKIYG